MRRRRGNILFLILIAIILFVALTYAIMGQREGSKNASSESVQTKVANITQFFDQVDAVVLRMRLTEGYKPEQISFGHPGILIPNTPATMYHNSNCTTNACYVFKTDGGGAALRSFEAYGVDNPSGRTNGQTASGYYDLSMFQWPYAGTDANDVVITLITVDPAICPELNRALGITATPVTTGPFVGANNPSNWDNPATTFTTNASQLLGKNTYGVQAGIAPNHYCNIRHLLIARQEKAARRRPFPEQEF